MPVHSYLCTTDNKNFKVKCISSVATEAVLYQLLHLGDEEKKELAHKGLVKLKKGSLYQSAKRISPSFRDCAAGAEFLGLPAQVGDTRKKSPPMRV